MGVEIPVQGQVLVVVVCMRSVQLFVQVMSFTYSEFLMSIWAELQAGPRTGESHKCGVGFQVVLDWSRRILPISDSVFQSTELGPGSSMARAWDF